MNSFVNKRKRYSHDLDDETEFLPFKALATEVTVPDFILTVGTTVNGKEFSFLVDAYSRNEIQRLQAALESRMTREERELYRALVDPHQKLHMRMFETVQGEERWKAFRDGVTEAALTKKAPTLAEAGLVINMAPPAKK